MTDLATPPADAGSSPDASPPAAEPIPVVQRLVSGLVLVSLLVGLFLIVRWLSDDPPPPTPVVPGRPEGFGEAPKAGAVAPDFTVPTLDGETFSLSNHLVEDGRPVFVNMWAEWCFPCRQEMPAIDAASRMHPEIHFIGVVVRDEEAPARRFIEEYDITYQIGLDTDGAVERDYAVWVMPSTYLIGSDGTVIERFFGPLTETQLDELIASASGSVG